VLFASRAELSPPPRRYDGACSPELLLPPVTCSRHTSYFSPGTPSPALMHSRQIGFFSLLPLRHARNGTFAMSSPAVLSHRCIVGLRFHCISSRIVTNTD